MTEYLYEKIRDRGLETETLIQQDKITEKDANERKKTIQPARTIERIHIHEHNEPTSRNKPCIVRDLRP